MEGQGRDGGGRAEDLGPDRQLVTWSQRGGQVAGAGAKLDGEPSPRGERPGPLQQPDRVGAEVGEVAPVTLLGRDDCEHVARDEQPEACLELAVVLLERPGRHERLEAGWPNQLGQFVPADLLVRREGPQGTRRSATRHPAGAIELWAAELTVAQPRPTQPRPTQRRPTQRRPTQRRPTQRRPS